MRTRLLTVFGIAFAAALLALPAAAHAADGLVIQSVDTSRYPVVTLRVTMPPSSASAGKPSFTVAENGAAVGKVTSKATSSERDPIAVVLVFDTSGSMKGKPLEDAKAAAREFVAAMMPGDQVALVTFASNATVASELTDDRQRMLAAIDAVGASGETALYDGLLSAMGTASKSTARQRSIVLLSDGKDTVSANSADSVYSVLAGGGVPVFAIALQSPEYDDNVLKTVATRSGGRFLPVGDSASLSKYYQSIARELQTQWQLEYTSDRPETKDIDLDVAAAVGKQRLTAATVIPNPWFALKSAKVLDPPPIGALPSLLFILLSVLAVFLSASLLTFGILDLIAPPPTSLGQVGFYDQLKQADERAPIEEDGLAARMVGVVGQVAGRRGFTQLVSQKLERAGLPLRAAEYILLHFLGVLGIGLAAQLLLRNAVWSLIVVAAATVVPILLLDIAVDRRRRKFEEQLPDLLNLVSGSLRAGYGLLQAVNLVVQEMLPPASVEFRRVETEARLGLSVEQALEKMAQRLGSVDFGWTVAAINIQREVGGNLAEMLDMVAATIREREGLRRQMKALTAEGRLSAIILIILPFIEAALLMALNAGYFNALLRDPVGLVLIGMACMLLLVGALWLKRVVTIEV